MPMSKMRTGSKRTPSSLCPWGVASHPQADLSQARSGWHRPVAVLQGLHGLSPLSSHGTRCAAQTRLWAFQPQSLHLKLWFTNSQAGIHTVPGLHCPSAGSVAATSALLSSRTSAANPRVNECLHSLKSILQMGKLRPTVGHVTKIAFQGAALKPGPQLVRPALWGNPGGPCRPLPLPLPLTLGQVGTQCLQHNLLPPQGSGFAPQGSGSSPGEDRAMGGTSVPMG